jgi:hypothetical protein
MTRAEKGRLVGLMLTRRRRKKNEKADQHFSLATGDQVSSQWAACWPTISASWCAECGHTIPRRPNACFGWCCRTLSGPSPHPAGPCDRVSAGVQKVCGHITFIISYPHAPEMFGREGWNAPSMDVYENQDPRK